MHSRETDWPDRATSAKIAFPNERQLSLIIILVPSLVLKRIHRLFLPLLVPLLWQTIIVSRKKMYPHFLNLRFTGSCRIIRSKNSCCWKHHYVWWRLTARKKALTYHVFNSPHLQWWCLSASFTSPYKLFMRTSKLCRSLICVLALKALAVSCLRVVLFISKLFWTSPFCSCKKM